MVAPQNSFTNPHSDLSNDFVSVPHFFDLTTLNQLTTKVKFILGQEPSHKFDPRCHLASLCRKSCWSCKVSDRRTHLALQTSTLFHLFHLFRYLCMSFLKMIHLDLIVSRSPSNFSQMSHRNSGHLLEAKIFSLMSS